MSPFKISPKVRRMIAADRARNYERSLDGHNLVRTVWTENGTCAERVDPQTGKVVESEAAS